MVEYSGNVFEKDGVSNDSSSQTFDANNKHVTNNLHIRNQVPFVVYARKSDPRVLQKCLQIGSRHHGYLSLHLSTQDDVLDKVENAVNSGLEIVNIAGFWLVEYLQRLRHPKVK